MVPTDPAAQERQARVNAARQREMELWRADYRQLFAANAPTLHRAIRTLVADLRIGWVDRGWYLGEAKWPQVFNRWAWIVYPPKTG